MEKSKKVKKLVDMLMALLYILLLGYVFTGGEFHEIAGIVFVALVVIHNLLNIRWYKAIKSGSYHKKRKLITTLNIALIVDVAAIAITGILNARYLFHFDMAIPGIEQIHKLAPLQPLEHHSLCISQCKISHKFGDLQVLCRKLCCRKLREHCGMISEHGSR